MVMVGGIFILENESHRRHVDPRDGISLVPIIVLNAENKFIYLVIISQLPLGRLGNNLINDTSFSQLVILSSVTIYQGISLNMKGYNLRKFIAGSSMINVGMLLIIATNQDFCLTQIVLIFYLLFYNLTCTGYFALLQRQNSKCGTLLYNDVPVIQLPVLKFIFMNQILGSGGFPVFNVVLIKFYINCMVAINRCILVLVLILTYTSLAANYSYLRIIRFISKQKISHCRRQSDIFKSQKTVVATMVFLSRRLSHEGTGDKPCS